MEDELLKNYAILGGVMITFDVDTCFGVKESVLMTAVIQYLLASHWRTVPELTYLGFIFRELSLKSRRSN